MSDTEEHSHERKVGMNCPQCNSFIETSIYQLLTADSLRCPACQLKLSIDRLKSKTALDALNKVQQAKQALEKKSKFDR